jgi:hypothetical protein
MEKSDSIAVALGLTQDNTNEAYQREILDRGVNLLNKEDTFSDALIGFGQWSKLERLFSEEELSTYEKELLFVGYTIGALKVKKQQEMMSPSSDSLSQMEKMIELMERAKKIKDSL